MSGFLLRRLFYPLAWVALALGAVVPSPPAAAQGEHSLLVLHSYHKAEWTDGLLAGMESVLAARGDVALRVEYMDTKTTYSPAYLRQLAALYRAKYVPGQFDLILTTDDNALQFALQLRADLFAATPIVFCGVNRYRPEQLRSHADVTGVVEHGDFAATLALGARLLPGVQQVSVICDRTPTGQINLAVFREQFAEQLPGVALSVLQDVSLADLEDRLRQLPQGGFVYFISFWRDRHGRPVAPGELEEIFRSSPVPVLGRSEWMVGRGLVGGRCVHAFSQGSAAAELAARILDGEQAADLPVVLDSPNQYLFDYLELKRHGLDLELLPPQRMLVNAPEPFYAVDKGVAVLLLVSLAVALVLVAALAWTVRRRVRAETGLRRSEQLYRTLVDNIDLGISLIDTDYRVVMTNASQCRIFDQPVGFFDGKFCYREFERRNQPCDECPGRRALANGAPATLETEGVRQDGRRVQLRVSAFPAIDHLGEAMGFIEVVEDVSDRHRVETERRKLENRMRETQKLESLGLLAGGIAHDFNNLLMGILGNADLALLNMPPESPGRDFVQPMVVAAERAAELANQMLAYSGKGHFQVERLNLSLLVEEMTHLLQTVVSKQCRLQTRLAADLPRVEADATQLRQVVMNLITNASDALEGRNGTVSLCTGSDDLDSDYFASLPLFGDLPAGHYVYLEVVDTGRGMDAETRARMFDPFYTSKEMGRGLGLAAVQGIVRGHGGAIQVYSEPGRGSCIKVLLPAAEVLATESRSGGISPPPPKALPTGCILVVDDDRSVREVAALILRQAGYQVQLAADGGDALAQFRRQPSAVALVLLDMTMPGLSGEEVFCELRRLDPEVKVILSSGYSEEEAAALVAGKGSAAFIQKPYRAAQLLALVAEVAAEGPGQS